MDVQNLLDLDLPKNQEKFIKWSIKDTPSEIVDLINNCESMKSTSELHLDH